MKSEELLALSRAVSAFGAGVTKAAQSVVSVQRAFAKMGIAAADTLSVFGDRIISTSFSKLPRDEQVAMRLRYGNDLRSWYCECGDGSKTGETDVH